MTSKTPRTVIGEYLNASLTQNARVSRVQSRVTEVPRSPSMHHTSQRKSPAVRTVRSPGRAIHHDRVASLRAKRRNLSLNAEDLTPRTLVEAFLEGSDSTVPLMRQRKRTSQTGVVSSVPAMLRKDPLSVDVGRQTVSSRQEMSELDKETPRTLIKQFLMNASVETPHVNLRRNRDPTVSNSPDISVPSSVLYNTPSPFKPSPSDKTGDYTNRSVTRKTRWTPRPHAPIIVDGLARNAQVGSQSPDIENIHETYHTPSPFKSSMSEDPTPQYREIRRQFNRHANKEAFLLDIPPHMLEKEHSTNIEPNTDVDMEDDSDDIRHNTDVNMEEVSDDVRHNTDVTRRSYLDQDTTNSKRNSRNEPRLSRSPGDSPGDEIGEASHGSVSRRSHRDSRSSGDSSGDEHREASHRSVSRRSHMDSRSPGDSPGDEHREASHRSVSHRSHRDSRSPVDSPGDEHREASHRSHMDIGGDQNTGGGRGGELLANRSIDSTQAEYSFDPENRDDPADEEDVENEEQEYVDNPDIHQSQRGSPTLRMQNDGTPVRRLSRSSVDSARSTSREASHRNFSRRSHMETRSPVVSPGDENREASHRSVSRRSHMDTRSPVVSPGDENREASHRSVSRRSHMDTRSPGDSPGDEIREASHRSVSRRSNMDTRSPVVSPGGEHREASHRNASHRSHLGVLGDQNAGRGGEQLGASEPGLEDNIDDENPIPDESHTRHDIERMEEDEGDHEIHTGKEESYRANRSGLREFSYSKNRSSIHARGNQENTAGNVMDLPSGDENGKYDQENLDDFSDAEDRQLEADKENYSSHNDLEISSRRRSLKSGLNKSSAVPDAFSPPSTSTQQPQAERNEEVLDEESEDEGDYEDEPVVEPVVQTKKRAVRRPRQKSAYTLPVSLVKRRFTHFAGMRVSKEAIEEVMKVSEEYWDFLAQDLEAYALHAGRKRINMEDFHLLFKRQGLVHEKQCLNSLIEKYLPMEERRKLIPVARAGSKVELKK